MFLTKIENSRGAGPAGLNMARGVALFLGLFALAGVAVFLSGLGFDPNSLWIDLRLLPTPLRMAAIIALSIALIFFSARPARNRIKRFVSVALVMGFSIVAALNAAEYWWLIARGAIESQVPVPISAIVCLILFWILRSMLGKAAETPPRPGIVAALCIGCAVLFPVFQVFGFGKTSYERRADVAVVFGARVYADGRLSDAVYARVATAAHLYQHGAVQHLVMSGGPGDGRIHEADAMRREAIASAFRLAPSRWIRTV